MKIFIK